ncbi:phosphoribosylamine--glycine ligase [Abditibacterium utsteinense]|uniref:Phosphoribosylamine--glycine ligase n=1 Tax=Abditibacterium utsteinense TaxID=1960156 RepID=A0A2S8SQ05_9BACT|nr:phosphoribosylamine--glycine ligase [Abditibacterium utsteinense]PQV62883.1 phosphoribosylamine--glycine ligase [Abditibacterium utsteinense]
MKILVVGSGGREHALVWKILQSPLVSQVVCTPGNAGIAQICECLAGEPTEIAQKMKADFVVVGPDGALADGLVDRLNAAGFPAFGPTQSAARLESSKIFTKNLLQKYAVPSAKFASFKNAEDARNYLEAQPDGPIVVKADGLAVGKGVVVAESRAQAIAGVEEVLGIAAQTVQNDAGAVVIEEFMSGEEISFFALCDGEELLPLIDVQDHKRLGDGDTGPNTGGMGCYSPVPSFTPALRETVIETILKPTLQGLKSEGIEYRGVLYCGLMLTETGPKVVEYNARFGDPECQLLMPLLKSDIVPVLLACAGIGEKKLSDFTLEWSDEAAVIVVLAAEGYPASPRKGDAISGLENVRDALVFHAGTKIENGEIVTNGGRVLGVVGLGDSFETAREKAYAATEKIHFDGMHFRRDIGWRAAK